MEKTCWYCKEKIDLEDKFCKHCGKGQDEKSKFLYTFKGLILLSCVIGPFAIKSVMNSPVLNSGAKKKFVLVLLVLSIVLGIYCIKSVSRTLSYYEQVLNM